MDAAVPVDAKNARPPGTWKTAENAVSHSAHTHYCFRERMIENGESTSVAKPSTESDQAQSADTWLCLHPYLLLDSPVGHGQDHPTSPLRSIAITATSSLLRATPPQCLASVLRFLWGHHLNGSLGIETTGSRSSVEKPGSDRGGPRNSDSWLRWDPDQGEGVWNTTEATE